MEQQKTRNVILITEGSLQSSLLKDVLETKLGISVALITPDSLIHGALDSPLASAIIVDCSVITDDIFRRYSEFKESQQKDTLEILINCDQSISTEDLFAWRTLAGIFYTSDDIKTLQVGIGKVLQGICGSAVSFLSNTLLTFVATANL